MTNLETSSFGPHLYGSTLHINSPFIHLSDTDKLIIDVETDEKDNFVGLALTEHGDHIYYYTELNQYVKNRLEGSYLIGHNLKGDIKWLINWGINIKSGNLYYDTSLASYVQNTTKESHGLKDLAKEYLNMEWPSYKDMVGKGKLKKTLDKQGIDIVANYCGMDCLATFKLYEYFNKNLTPFQKRYLETIELPTARALLEMELKGALIDVSYIKDLDAQFKYKMDGLIRQVYTQWIKYNPRKHTQTCVFKRGNCSEHSVPKDLEFNINSNNQIANLLEQMGATLPKTKKGNRKVDKATLANWIQIPVVPIMLDYSKIENLYSTYTQGLLEKQKNSRIHCSFNQITRNENGNEVGISTSRLSSSHPNLQNIPTRTDEGKLIRRAFVAPSDTLLIDADYNQIEYRLLAHFSGEPRLIKAFQEGKDVHEETGNALGVSRDLGKTLNFAAIYGAQAGKISRTAKIDESQAEKFLEAYWKVLPCVTAWVMRTKYVARAKRGVFTLNRRWIPLPGIASQNKYEQMHWERAAVNYVIQGSAAEIMKMGLIKLREAKYSTVLTVHDEFLIEFKAGMWDSHLDEDYACKDIKCILENLIILDVPLKVEIGIGDNWEEAKL